MSLPLLTGRYGRSAEEVRNQDGNAPNSARSQGFSVPWTSPSAVTGNLDRSESRSFSPHRDPTLSFTKDDGDMRETKGGVVTEAANRGPSPLQSHTFSRVQTNIMREPAGARVENSPRVNSSELAGSQKKQPYHPIAETHPWNSLLGGTMGSGLGKTEKSKKNVAGSFGSNFQDTILECPVDEWGMGTTHSAAGASQKTGGTKTETLLQIGRFLTISCARHVKEPQRSINFRKVLTDIGNVYPHISQFLSMVVRYMKETSDQLENAQKKHQESLIEKEKELYKRFDTFFENKIYGILKEKKELEGHVRRLERESLELRKNRDEALMKVKEELITTMNDCAKREDEFAAFRHLIASTFRGNEELSLRIETLEELLRKHLIEVPPAPPAVKAAGALRNHGDTPSTEENTFSRANWRPITTQVPIEFMKASAEELSAARLTLQKELLNCAFDERTAYRLEVNNLKAENLDLRMTIDTLEKTVMNLDSYIHEKRFLAEDEHGNAPMTPRPQNLPFSIQSELGIDLKKRTAEIMAELCSISVSLKHQLNSSLLRLRQMITVSEWMREDTLVQVDTQKGGTGVLPTVPMQLWPSVPHFLRTNVYPDVTNVRWTEYDAGAILLEFFNAYKELQRSCIRYRDKKMVQPKVLQMFERRTVNLTPHDATIAQMQKDERAVPFGYVVSEFIRRYFFNLGTGGREGEVQSGSLALPGTLNPTFRVGTEKSVVELEFTRFAYNMWWAAHYYRDTQPLCDLFVEVANGHLPIGLYDVMSQCLGFVEKCVKKLDFDGSGTFLYSKLSQGMLRIVDDLGQEANRSAILACAQSFEENKVPIFGGRIMMAALLANEATVLPDETVVVNGVRETTSHLPPRLTLARMPKRCLQPPGASVFLRYWRRLVLREYQLSYKMIEELLSPLVAESEIVFGLYVLPIPEALAAIDEIEKLSAPKHSLTTAFSELFFQEAEGERRGALEAYNDLLKTQEEAFRHRLSQRKELIQTVFNELIRELPRLNRSVHFPFSDALQHKEENSIPSRRNSVKAKEEVAKTSTKTFSSPNTKSGKRHARARVSRPTEAVNESFLVKRDRELVEWYGFCHALRQRRLPLPGKLYVCSASNEPIEWLIPKTDNYDEEDTDIVDSGDAPDTETTTVEDTAQ